MAKCTDKSVAYRNQGNRAFRIGRLREALGLYNQALLYAPVGTEAYNSALGNRSACLFEMKEYKACLRDIDRVLQSENVSQKLRTKLVIRNEKAEKQCVQGVGVEEKSGTDVLNLLRETSEYCQNLRRSVKVGWSEEKGRSLVATVDICAGDVVIVEAPFCSVLLPHFADVCCHHCCKPLPFDPLPCSICTEKIYFCDELCRKIAMERYHWAECTQVERLSNLGITHLAYRILLACPIADLKKYSGCVEQTTPANSQNALVSSSFDSVVCLESHHSKTVGEDLSTYKKTADGLMKLLDTKGYFDHNFKDKSETKIEAHTVVVSLIERLICNAHAINRIWDSDDIECGAIVETEQRKIGSGLYPVASIMNHSCIPNIFSSFVDGNVLVVRAVQNIKRGEELFNCYGPRFGRMERRDRLEALKQQYFFDCHCIACDSKELQLKESHFDGLKCDKCGNILEILEKSFCLNVGCCHKCKCKDEKILPLDLVPGPGGLQFTLGMFRLNAHKYNKKLLEYIDAVACEAVKNGQFDGALGLLVESLEGTAFWFGDDSIEYAQEIVKLMPVLDKCKQHAMHASLKEYAAKANIIFKIYYGTPCHHLLQYL